MPRHYEIRFTYHQNSRTVGRALQMLSDGLTVAGRTLRPASPLVLTHDEIMKYRGEIEPLCRSKMVAVYRDDGVYFEYPPVSASIETMIIPDSDLDALLDDLDSDPEPLPDKTDVADRSPVVPPTRVPTSAVESAETGSPQPTVEVLPSIVAVSADPVEEPAQETVSAVDETVHKKTTENEAFFSMLRGQVADRRESAAVPRTPTRNRRKKTEK